ncbi:restriction endonuclease subunit S [Rathayibacter sp. AY2B7]|uniref:restriction endonuclease subunit S n=1 Tax=Rathayibacter sp. AY2B7 TaxID=2080571 RepID=UPI0015E3CAE4|nr:restriction endonuclease subunit S [Rathayibacter sp. AY2B7]
MSALIDHRGKTPAKLGSEFVDVGIPVLSAILVTEGRVEWESARYVTQEIFERWMPNKIRKGDILLTSEAPLGRVARVNRDGPVVLGQRLFALRSDPLKLDQAFLYYSLLSETVQQRILNHGTGSTVVGIRQPALLSVSIPAPELAEQRAIAEVLGALDDKIAANQQSSHLALRLAILSVPTGMPKIRLGAVTAYNRSSINPDGVQEPRVKHYSLPAFDASKVPTTESPLNIKSSKVLLLNPVVLLSKLNPRTPRIWEVPSIDGICLASGEFLALEPIGFSTSALWAVLSQKEVTRALEERVSGTSGSHQRVLPNDVLALEIHDPNEMSDSLRDLIGASTALSHSLSVENTELSRLRDTLLPALMSGKLRVKDAERAVEDVL